MGRLVEQLPWDTEFFGFPIGLVTLDGADDADFREIEEEARDLGLVCLYGTLQDPNRGCTAIVAQEYGFRLVEVSRLYERPATPVTYRSSDADIRPGTLEDIPALSDALETVAAWSRFGADPRFGLEAAHLLHIAWVERAAQDEDRLLAVAEDESGITGLTTGSRHGLPTCDFIANVRRGSGDAGALLQAVVDWADGASIQGGPIAARNIGVNRWMTRCEFIIKSVSYNYHRWLDEGVDVSHRS